MRTADAAKRQRQTSTSGNTYQRAQNARATPTPQPKQNAQGYRNSYYAQQYSDYEPEEDTETEVEAEYEEYVMEADDEMQYEE